MLPWFNCRIDKNPDGRWSVFWYDQQAVRHEEFAASLTACQAIARGHGLTHLSAEAAAAEPVNSFTGPGPIPPNPAFSRTKPPLRIILE